MGVGLGLEFNGSDRIFLFRCLLYVVKNYRYLLIFYFLLGCYGVEGRVSDLKIENRVFIVWYLISGWFLVKLFDVF